MFSAFLILKISISRATLTLRIPLSLSLMTLNNKVITVRVRTDVHIYIYIYIYTSRATPWARKRAPIAKYEKFNVSRKFLFPYYKTLYQRFVMVYCGIEGDVVKTVVKICAHVRVILNIGFEIGRG